MNSYIAWKSYWVLAARALAAVINVRPGEERHWRRYCRQYDACGQPVYFVRDDWYDHTYLLHYREYRRDRRSSRGSSRREPT